MPPGLTGGDEAASSGGTTVQAHAAIFNWARTHGQRDARFLDCQPGPGDLALDCLMPRPSSPFPLRPHGTPA